jgi:hypothetical protein
MIFLPAGKFVIQRIFDSQPTAVTFGYHIGLGRFIPIREAAVFGDM